MPDERAPVDPNDPAGLGLTAEDLADFDANVGVGDESDVGDQESTLAQPPAVITEEQAAPTKVDQQPPSREPAPRQPESATPHAVAERASSPEERQSAAGRAPTDPAPSAPKPESTAVVPWEPSADGRRLKIDGATIEADGTIRVPPGSVNQLMSSLAYRPAWQTERQRLHDLIRLRDPQNNEDIILSRNLAAEMMKAADPAQGGSDETLWAWVQGFVEALPRLRAEAKAEAKDRENKILRSRTDREDRAAQVAELEPQLQQSLGAYLDRYLALDQFKALVPQRHRLAHRFWNELFHKVFAAADQDYPHLNPPLKKGEPFVQLGVIEEELLYAAQLLEEAQKDGAAASQRDAAAKRNAAALGDGTPPPPAPVGSRTMAGEPSSGNGRPRTREEWADRMASIAETP
jgi:hypothetical protein